jgi:alpha-L-fucosidase
MTTNLILPTAQQRAWGDAELGVIIHLDLQVFERGYEFREQWGYTPSPSVFNPAELDTDQWIEAAVAAGAKYAVLVAKHCSGFSLWPTKAHDYSVASSPWRDGKGDIVRDFFASCAKYGIKPGLYCSLSCNAHFNVDNPGLVRDRDPQKQAAYNEMAMQQLTELWTNYGPLFEIWFDGGVLPPEQGGPDVAGLMARLQPDAVVFQGPATWAHPVRDSGIELSTAVLPNWSTTSRNAYQRNDHSKKAGDPSGELWAQTECDIPNRKAGLAFQGGWFWRPGDEPYIYSSDELVEGYFRSVGQNSNLLIGMVIDDRGKFPEPDTEAFEEFGDTLKRMFRNLSAKTSGIGKQITLPLPSGSKPTIVSLAENLAYGECVRRFNVEAFVDGKWQTIWDGTAIGHKRLERFEPLNATHLRLNILESVGEPRIREFAAYAADTRLFSEPLSLAQRSKLFIARDAAGSVSITCSNPSLAIRYTTDGSEPNAKSPRYQGPFAMPDGGVVKAYSYIEGGSCLSDTTTVVFGGSRSHWRIADVSLDSPYENGGAAGVAKLLDDDPESYWHTYHVDKAKSAAPHYVVLDAQQAVTIGGFTLMPRVRALSGTPDEFEFHVSEDGESWNLVADAVIDDWIERPVARLIPLDRPVKARYVKFVAKHVIDGLDYVAVAGIGTVPVLL